MEPIEQPGFDRLDNLPDYPDNDKRVDIGDRHELINEGAAAKASNTQNGESQSAENSPLHEQDDANSSILCSPQNYGLRVIIVSSIVFAVAVTVALILTIYLEPKQIHGHAAVAAEDIRCSDTGIKFLKEGGNAVDAAVSVAFCMAVVRPDLSGLGGGGFAIVHDHKFSTSSAYNFRESAPGKEITQKDLDGQLDLDGSILSTGVPGFVKGIAAMHKAHGIIPWKDLLQPSIDLAEFGFVKSEDLKKSLVKCGAKCKQNAQIAKYLIAPTETVKLPELADTLKQVARNHNALYDGKLMVKFVQEMTALQGFIREEDMMSYNVTTPPVLSSKFQGLTVLGLPAPAGGPLVAFILSLVNQLDVKASERNTSVAYHKILEAFKFAYGQKSLLGDPNYDQYVRTEEKQLLSAEFISLIAKRVTNVTYQNASHYGPFPPAPTQGTSHFSIVDSSEVMVSMTTSLNHRFGNGIMLPKTGIVLNNQLLDFNDFSKGIFDKTPLANSYGRFRRPMSSMAPTIVYNADHPCEKRIIIGATNGSRITTAVAETIINSVLFKMGITAAIEAPRVHNQLDPMVTEYEQGFPQSIVDDLKAMGYNMVEVDEGLSLVQAIEKRNDDLDVFSDTRLSGSPSSTGSAAKY